MLAEWQRIWPHLAYGTVLLGLVGMLWAVRLRLRAVHGACERERRGREEMEAYMRLDVRVGRDGGVEALGSSVCGTIAARSPFGRVAMLVRDAEGHLCLAASEGMDDAMLAAIKELARSAVDGCWNDGVQMGVASLVVRLGEGRVVAVPVGATGGRIVGAMLVCADSILQVPRRRAEEAIVGLEALAVKLGRAMESVEPAGRLKRAGKLGYSRSYPFKVVVGNVAQARESTGVSAQPRGQRQRGLLL